MKHYDYEWDLDTYGIVLDPELNVDKFGWQAGDYFKLVNVNGRCRLVKIDPIEKFLLDGEQQLLAIVNEQDDTVRFIDQEQYKTKVVDALRKKND